MVEKCYELCVVVDYCGDGKRKTRRRRWSSTYVIARGKKTCRLFSRVAAKKDTVPTWFSRTSRIKTRESNPIEKWTGGQTFSQQTKNDVKTFDFEDGSI